MYNKLKFGLPDFLNVVSLSHKCDKLLLGHLKSAEVSTFLVMSERNAIRPWHVAYSHTSLMYIVLTGVQEFVFYERTARIQIA